VKRTALFTGLTSCYRTSTNYVDWNKVQDVDMEEDCCFGYLDLQTWDQDLGDVTLRVRRSQVEEIAQEVHNKSTGRHHGAKATLLHQFREAGFCNCMRCFGTRYILTDDALKVKSTTPLHSKVNNVAWHKVHDIDHESNCCYGYIDVTTGDRELGDVVLRVWSTQVEKITDLMRNLRAGRTDAHDRTLRKFYPRSWFDWMTCYRGRCCLYHPLSYWVMESGIKVRRISLVNPQSGVYRSKTNHIPWHNIRDVDSHSDCCWGFIDVDTADRDEPNFVVRVCTSELESIMAALRSRGACDDGTDYHTGHRGVAADPNPGPMHHPFSVP